MKSHKSNTSSVLKVLFDKEMMTIGGGGRLF